MRSLPFLTAARAAVLAAGMLAATNAPAMAWYAHGGGSATGWHAGGWGGGWHGGWGGYHGGYGWGYHGWGPGAFAAGAVLGLGVGAVAAGGYPYYPPAAYYPPAPRYYVAPPVVYAPQPYGW